MDTGVRLDVVDYRNPEQAQELVHLMDHYARDPMGGGEGLSPDVRNTLPERLAEIPGAYSVLLTLDGESAGLLNAFQGFSTFKARPLMNIHDVVIHRHFRGRGLTRYLFGAVEEEARRRGCCKVTLEVLQGNETARLAYQRLGYSGYSLDDALGCAEFWQKVLE